ncbi:MAG: EamA family transporter [Bdellovibrionales bacterium]|nr:EamA family transporter [Oligoflexia bacterium]
MNFSQIGRLVFVAAIWGASHVLVRITVPELGPILTAFLRIGIAALTLTIFQMFSRVPFKFKNNWKFYLMVGVLYTSLPLSLFALASVYLPSAYLVILNATTPIFAAIFSALVLKEAFGLRKLGSLMLGLSGVFLLKEFGSIKAVTPEVMLAMAMGLLASASYGLCGVLVKKYGSGENPTALTTGSNLFASALLLPLAVQSFHQLPSPQFIHHSAIAVTVSIFILGVFGSALAFVVFYGLIREIGPFKASLTTFLMPVFGIIWGLLFLDEPLTWGMGAGAVLVVASTAFFVRKR